MDSNGEPRDPTPPRRAARLARLRVLVGQRGAVHLASAAADIGVSAMTLRRDLAAAGARDLALLGGHVTSAPAGDAALYVLTREAEARVAAKRAAARAAARFASDGATLFVDCGTTMPYLIASLAPRLALTIVCYALNIATLAANRPRTRLILLGGAFHPSSATFYAEEEVRRLAALRIDVGFFSAGGVDRARGASCFHFHEVPIKQAALAAAARRYLVVDESKLNRTAPAPFAPWEAFDAIITGPPPGPPPGRPLGRPPR